MIEMIKALASKKMEVFAKEGLQEATIKTVKESAVQNSFETIENTSLESLKAQNELTAEKIEPIEKNRETGANREDIAYKELQKELPKNEGDKQNSQGEIIKNKSLYSDHINKDISTKNELDIYENAGLKEENINDKDCLVRDDLKTGQKDEMGMSNIERMEKGKPPLDKDNNPIELHHIGQKNDGSFAELTKGEHRGEGNSGILHDSSKSSEINRVEFQKQKSEHWQARAENYKPKEA